jgi:hypothetical protein
MCFTSYHPCCSFGRSCPRDLSFGGGGEGRNRVLSTRTFREHSQDPTSNEGGEAIGKQGSVVLAKERFRSDFDLCEADGHARAAEDSTITFVWTHMQRFLRIRSAQQELLDVVYVFHLVNACVCIYAHMGEYIVELPVCLDDFEYQRRYDGWLEYANSARVSTNFGKSSA